MADVLTSEEVEELRKDVESGVIPNVDTACARLLATLDAAHKELAELRRKVAHSKGSYF